MLRRINGNEDFVEEKQKVKALLTQKRRIEEEKILKNEKIKKPKYDKVKLPTLEEINELKETQNLFHSNLFRLQVKELLQELKVKEKYAVFLNIWLERFQKFLKEFEFDSKAKEECTDVPKWLKETPFKLPLALGEIRSDKRLFHFQFIKPTTQPYFVGAAATGTFLGPKIVADVCIEMPAAFFQKENCLNLVYDQKRALYLVYIANKMIEKGFDDIELSHMEFNYYANNPLKPVLLITSINKRNTKQKISIRVFIATEESTFKLSRFVPWNNNIRSKLFDDTATTTDESKNAATPHYNSNVLFDLTLQSNQIILNNTFKSRKNLQEALILLKVWIRQRHLHVGYTGFSSHIMAMLICYLFRQKNLHQNMSSYQVVRTVWNYIAHSDISVEGICLKDGSCSTTMTRPTLAEFHKHYEVVFIDVTGFYNICSNLSLEIYKRVRVEAKIALDMLNDMKVNSFQMLFMTKYPLYVQLDQILKISKSDVVEQILEMYVPLSVKQDYVNYSFPQLLKIVSCLLQKGLGQRVQAVLPIEKESSSWSCASQPDSSFGKHLQLGFILHPMHAYEVLEKGPESITGSGEEFRRFWGDKAKLRRFQDGSISESVVWASSNDTLAQKRLVSRSIVLHLLQHHFQIEPNDVVYIANELDVVYKLTPSFKTEHMHEKYKVAQDTDAESLCCRVIHVFDDLAQKLYTLKELPLEIVSIVGTSPVFRYCEPTPLLPRARVIGKHFYASNVQQGIIQLASSGKWPNELPALQAMKIAFYIQIAELLREKYKLAVKVTYNGLLIIKQGYCFNIKIAHPKEIALLKHTKTERGFTQCINSCSSIEFEKLNFVLPKVTGALHALHHHYSSFGGAVMIAKRWLYSQLIDPGHWPDECTELLIASLYLRDQGSQQITCSPQLGFIKFIQLIAFSDWKTEFFFLNFNSAMSENEITKLHQRFNTERTQFPALCIATAYDRDHFGKLWSSEKQPSIHIMTRVTLLARQALEMIESKMLNLDEGFIHLSKLFVHSTEGYDIVIQLKPENIPNTSGFHFGSRFSPFTKPNWRLPLADTDLLTTAVTNLREAYGNLAAFFFNPCGGNAIGVVWKPHVFAEKEFKVNEVQACNITKNRKIQCCFETLVEDFKFILNDCYIRIDTVENIINSLKEEEPVCSSTAKSNSNNYDHIEAQTKPSKKCQRKFKTRS